MRTTACLLGLLLAAQAALAQAPIVLAPEDAAHLLSRATFGVRPADIDALLEQGTDEWLERQLDPSTIPDTALERRLRRYPAAQLPIATLWAGYRPPGPADSAMGDTGPQPTLPPGRMLADLVAARMQRAIYSERQLEEIMTEFWFNHFNVFWQKGAVRWLVADYERHAIRPHVFGRFEDLLRATARHPAMLYFLDNVSNVAPTSPPRGSGAQRGINENYARELLELHTLGVSGGYAESDIRETARALTGWGVSAPRRRARGAGSERPATFSFAFHPLRHDTATKQVMMEVLPAGPGPEDGELLLRRLAAHPATARHVATRLATWFVADDPPAALVDRMTDVFLATDGDLREVTRMLFTAPEMLDPLYRGAKVRTPVEYVVAALRVSRAEVMDGRRLLPLLREMGQVPYLESSPAGYPLTNDAWSSAGALFRRMQFARDLAGGSVRGIGPPRVVRPDACRDVERFVDLLLPGAPPASDVRAAASDIAAGTTARDRSCAEQMLAIALASPRFQRR